MKKEFIANEAYVTEFNQYMKDSENIPTTQAVRVGQLELDSVLDLAERMNINFSKSYNVMPKEVFRK